MVRRWNPLYKHMVNWETGEYVLHSDYLKLQEALEKALKLAKRYHYYSEDPWYSCPKAPDGCANEHAGTECNCGADKTNAELAKLSKEFLEG